MGAKHAVIAAALLSAPLLATIQPVSAKMFAGDYTLSISQISGGWSPKAANLSDDLANPFSLVLNLGSSTGDKDFYTATPPGSGSGKNDTATITVTFTQLSDGSASTLSSYTETAIWEADYNNQTDSITWSDSGSDLDPIVVDFVDGAVLDITLVNASDWSIVPEVNFTFVDAPAPVPEPTTLALLGAAFAGLGLLRAARAAHFRSRQSVA
jgi:PEP-CTERM motif